MVMIVPDMFPRFKQDELGRMTNDTSLDHEKHEGYKHETKITQQLLICLLVEHIISYVIINYRKYDIAHNGKLDINGVLRANKESKLQ